LSETLYIIDGHSQIYRAYYAPFRNLTSPTGEPTRATYVFCSMLLKFIKDRQPRYLVMAADGPTEQLLRRDHHPAYKATRKATPDDLPVQIARIMQIVAEMGIPIITAPRHEADDVIATLVEQYASSEMNVVLVSRDKDLDQLIGPNVVFYDPMKDQMLDAAGLQAEKGYNPQQAVEVQSLCGDAIDNIPGIEGIGPKTAAKLIQQYGTADNVIAHASELTPKLAERVLRDAANVVLARRLVTLDRHVPLEADLESMRFAGVRGERLGPLFAELGFSRLLEQLDQLGAGSQTKLDVPAVASRQGQTSAADFDYRCIDTPEALAELSRQLAGVRQLGIDTETTDTQPMWCKLVGISLAWEDGRAYYLPVRTPFGARCLELADIQRVLGPVLVDERVQKIGHNLKYDWLVLSCCGLPIRGPIFDTMIAAHVLDSGRDSFSLNVLGAEYLNHRSIPIEELIGRGKNQTTMDKVPVELVTPYACEDADICRRLANVLRPQLIEQGLMRLFEDLEMPLLPVLAEMERRGILVDPDALRRMQVNLAARADDLRARIIKSAGVEFNPDSPRQLADVLFVHLKLPTGKQTKSGYSTDSDVLESLAADHPVPALMLEYRQLTKLLSTYAVALHQCIHPGTCRIHTSFHQTGAETGRLSSSEPNLQNIPVRTEEGRQIRSAFVAEPGSMLLSADYSQVEIRMLAHLCQDPTLLAAFAADHDIHRIVAAEVFGVSLDEVTPDMRARAKTVNFGIIYGQTAFGLAATLRIGRREAGDFIAAYRRRFPKIDDFLQSCVRHARQHGYVQTIFGRRRRIANIDARNPGLRALAERLAINSVVQGSAADLIKQAMLNIDRRITAENRPSRMLLQIHDELLLETPQQAIDAERQMVEEEMSGAIKLSVPLKVEIGVGRNWMEAK
jgi:DNA polymerase-1